MIDAFEGMELQVANELLMEHRIPNSFQLRLLVAQCLVFEAERLGSAEKAMDHMRTAVRKAQDAGERRWRFWFQDQGYLPQSEWATARFQPGYVPQDTPDEEGIYRTWQSMSETYRKNNPWRGKVFS